jgi:xeroderma pigmentosum group C-complementing protein
MEMLYEAARTRSGSRDVGAWLFTSLLRSAGVETRLVCSLQPLQFGFQNEGSRQQFVSDPPEKPTGLALDVKKTGKTDISSTAMPVEAQESVGTQPTRNPSFPGSYVRQTGTYNTPAQYIKQTKTFSPNHPFFWAEAWDVASQKWIVVEPMVAARVNQPSRIEPPNTAAAWETGTMGDNILSYAIGFDNSISSRRTWLIIGGFAKDVTRRYAKAYYAKTWRNRIESQEGGEKWWNATIKLLDRIEPLVFILFDTANFGGSRSIGRYRFIEPFT